MMSSSWAREGEGRRVEGEECKGMVTGGEGRGSAVTASAENVYMHSPASVRADLRGLQHADAEKSPFAAALHGM
jgi:hypothetical protein